jgi:hypothetical protein
MEVDGYLIWCQYVGTNEHMTSQAPDQMDLQLDLHQDRRFVSRAAPNYLGVALHSGEALHCDVALHCGAALHCDEVLRGHGNLCEAVGIMRVEAIRGN